MVWVQPLLVALVPSRVTKTLLQHPPLTAGGLVGIGLPQVMNRLLHNGVAGTCGGVKVITRRGGLVASSRLGKTSCMTLVLPGRRTKPRLVRWPLHHCCTRVVTFHVTQAFVAGMLVVVNGVLGGGWFDHVMLLSDQD